MVLVGAMLPCAAAMENPESHGRHPARCRRLWALPHRAPMHATFAWLAATSLGSLPGCGSPGGADAHGSSSETGAPTTIVPEGSDGPGSSSTGMVADTSSGPSETTAAPGDVGVPPSDGCAEFDAFAAELALADASDRVALTEAFLAAASRSDHGLPIRCEGRLVGVLWDDGGGVLAMTGDFADWDPRAHPLVPLVDGFDLHVADIAVAEPLAPSMYKFVRDDAVYFADPLARRHGWDEFGEFSLTDARTGVGHHERWLDFAEGVGTLGPRTIVVYVPADALAEGGPALPVLYMHDGQNLFAPDASFGGWQVGAAIDAGIASREIPPMLVVGIDNTAARFDEYTHVEDDLGSGPVGGRADEYADFVALGVKPFIDARYPTRPDPEATAVLGSSLGGLVSLYIGWRHPDVFGRVGSMSGTLDWGRIGLANDRVIELYGQQPPESAWLYLDSGGDGPCPGGSDNYCANVEMRGLLGGLGWTEPDRLVYVHVAGASHDEAAWAARLPGFLAALGLAVGSG